MMTSPEPATLLQESDQQLIALELLVDDVLTARDQQDLDAVRSTLHALHRSTYLLLVALDPGRVLDGDGS